MNHRRKSSPPRNTPKRIRSADKLAIADTGVHNGAIEWWVAALPSRDIFGFNTNGDSGADADIEPFFRVLSGRAR